jgi:hypothetical protein
MEMVRWNPALVRWTFESYGIAILKQALLSAGAAPVIYISGDKYTSLPPEERFRFQIHEPPGKDWSREKEWRIKGDLYLDRIPRDDLVIVLPRHEQERWGKTSFNFKVAFV